MFNRKTEKTELEETITYLQIATNDQTLTNEERLRLHDQLIAAHKLTPSKNVSPDTLAVVAGNIIGIVLILGYERVHVITSKALPFAGKLKN